MKRNATRPDLLERFAALGVPANKFEEDNQLPRNLIPKMRQGDYSGMKAQGTILKLEEAISRAEGAKAAAAAGAKLTPKTIAKFTPPTDDETRSRGELRDAILKAEDIHAVDECNKKVAAALIDGIITDTSARVLKELLGERRQSLEDKLEQEATARGAEKVEIQVTTVADWRKKGPCPYCAGTGQIDPEAKLS